MPPVPAKPPRVGRPLSEAAASHAAIMDAVYALLQERSARDLTMEAVAKRAGVGKPTLYKWWPSKAALIFAMFRERIVAPPAVSPAMTVEASLRAKMRNMIEEFNGLFGKVMVELIAEGQHDPAVLQELYQRHIGIRRASGVADIERGKAIGEIADDVDPDLLMDQIFAPVYYRRLLRLPLLNQDYGEKLIEQALRGARAKGVRS